MRRERGFVVLEGQGQRTPTRLGTLGDPEMAPGVIDAYKQAARAAGNEPGEIIIQLQFSYPHNEADALEGARVWKDAQPDAFYSDDWHDPEAMYEKGEREISDEDLAEARRRSRPAPGSSG